MSKALVIAKAADILTVEIERDLTRLVSYKSNLDQSITKLDAQEIIASDKLNISEAELELSIQKLNNAIDLDEPKNKIVLFSADVSLKITIVKIDRKSLAFITNQRLRFNQDLISVDVELARNITIPITMADTGSNIQVGQTIGLAEYTRLNNPDSIYVALPSDSAIRPNRQIYNAARDGITLPILGQEPWGWFYNTMVVPSAQIFRPRYWVAEILQKSDVTNTAVIYINKSSDFGTIPTHKNRVLESNVFFEYEDTNSKSFNVGDLVLIEYSGETPLIIGFGVGERLGFFGGAAPYTIIGTNVFIGIIPGGEYVTDLVNPLMTSDAGGSTRSTGADKSANIGYAKPLLNQNLDKLSRDIDNLDYGSIVQGETQSSSVIDLVFAMSISNMNQLYFKSGVDITMLVTQENAVIPLTPFNTDWSAKNNYVQSGPPPQPVPGQDYIGSSAFSTDEQSTFESLDAEEDSFNFFVFDDATGGPGGSSDFFELRSRKSNKVFLDDESQESPSTYTKLKSIAKAPVGGMIVPIDYLWPIEKINLLPNKEEVLLVFSTNRFGSPRSVTNNDFSFSTGYGAPLVPFSGAPISTNGTQNLVPFSEDFTQNTQTSYDLLGDLIKTPDGNVTGQQWMRTGLNSSFIFTIPAASGSLTFSIFLRRNAFMNFSFKAGTGGINQIDLITGTIDSVSGVSDSGIVPLSGEWYRVWFSLSEAVDITGIELKVLTSNGVGLNGIVMWGLQVTQSLGLENYVKTTGTPIT